MYAMERNFKTVHFNTMGFVGVVAVLATIAAMILAYKFIVPEKRRPRLNKLGQFLHDVFNFKFLIVEKIMQFFYVLSTIFTVCYGVLMIFGLNIYRSEYYNRTEWFGIYGILLAIVGPFVIRLAYELMMLFILLVKNVIQINKKLKGADENPEYQFPSFKDLTSKDNFDFIKKAKAQPAQPAATPVVQPVQKPEVQEPVPENE